MSGMTITLKPALFRGDWDQARSQYSLLWFMEAMCRVNQSHIRQFNHLAEKGIKKPYPRVYKSGVHYERERGTEEWLDIPNILAGGSYAGVYPGPWDDCLPLATPLLRSDMKLIPIGGVKVGDRIMAQGEWTEVIGWTDKGVKPVIIIQLDNGGVIRCTTEHRLFLSSGEEIRAGKIASGMSLMTPGDTFPVNRGEIQNLLRQLPEDCRTTTSYPGKPAAFNFVRYGHANTTVTNVFDDGEEHVCDIETQSRKFWLPESDLVVHNCEGLACWRVAELRELPWHWQVERIDRATGKRFTDDIDCAYPPPPGAIKVKGGIKAKPFAKFKRRDDGSYAYHALTLLPDGRLEDPSLTMGMTWEHEFHTRGIAKKYQSGELPIQIRYAENPESVVIDPESPTGYSARIERAKQLTGIAGPEDEVRRSGDVTNESPEEMIAGWGAVNEAPPEDIDRMLARANRSGGQIVRRPMRR